MRNRYIAPPLARRAGRHNVRESGGRSVIDTDKLRKGAPTLRIERSAHLHTVYRDEWHDFIDEFSGKHRHLKPKSLGGIACTYVESPDLNAMLAKRYPDAYHSRKGIVDIQKGFVLGFQTFVQNSLQAVREREADGLLRERFGRTYEHAALETPEKDLNQMWGVGEAVVKAHFAIADGNSLVFDLTSNEFLWQEHREICDYLRTEERLDLSLIHRKDEQGRPHQKPHATFVRSNRNIADTPLMVKGLTIPFELTFNPPRAWRESEQTKVQQIPEIVEL